MKAIWQNVVIAESNKTIVIEGNHYFPFDSANQSYLRESSHSSTCGWKGLANYYDIVVDDQINKNAIWVYRNPKPQANEIKNYLAFWNGVKVIE
jgi:uncharacterized protein (DUF427 family)